MSSGAPTPVRGFRGILAALSREHSVGGKHFRAWHPLLAGVLIASVAVPVMIGSGTPDSSPTPITAAGPGETQSPQTTPSSSPTAKASTQPKKPSGATSPATSPPATRRSGSSSRPRRAPVPPSTGHVSCTLILGFSQTRDWFDQLEASASATGIDPARWEMRGAGGAGVNRWAEANNDVWNTEIRSPCARNANAPERIVLTISAQIYENNVGWWEDQIRGAVVQIRAHYPRVQQIVLQPVVGGPSHQRCVDPATGDTVRATYNQPYIHQAIARVVGRDVVRGADPHVQACSQYRDWIGHLTDAGYAYQGRAIGAFYARFPDPS